MKCFQTVLYCAEKVFVEFQTELSKLFNNNAVLYLLYIIGNNDFIFYTLFCALSIKSCLLFCSCSSYTHSLELSPYMWEKH